MVSVPLSEGLHVSGNTTTRVGPNSERGSLLEFLKALPAPSYQDFMTRIFLLLFSKNSADLLVKSICPSTSRQCKSVWATFYNFLCSSDILHITCKVVFFLLRYVFIEKLVALSSVSSYKSTLGKPLLYAFGIDVSNKRVCELHQSVVLSKNH